MERLVSAGTRSNMILILLTTTAPHPLSERLAILGHSVYETLSISETFALAEKCPLATILVTDDVDEKRAKVVQERYPTLVFGAETTVKDILFEIAKTGTIQ